MSDRVFHQKNYTDKEEDYHHKRSECRDLDCEICRSISSKTVDLTQEPTVTGKLQISPIEVIDIDGLCENFSEENSLVNIPVHSLINGFVASMENVLHTEEDPKTKKSSPQTSASELAALHSTAIFENPPPPEMQKESPILKEVVDPAGSNKTAIRRSPRNSGKVVAYSKLTRFGVAQAKSKQRTSKLSSPPPPSDNLDDIELFAMTPTKPVAPKKPRPSRNSKTSVSVSKTVKDRLQLLDAKLNKSASAKKSVGSTSHYGCFRNSQLTKSLDEIMKKYDVPLDSEEDEEDLWNTELARSASRPVRKDVATGAAFNMQQTDVTKEYFPLHSRSPKQTEQLIQQLNEKAEGIAKLFTHVSHKMTDFFDLLEKLNQLPRT